jgi:excisionase family DNA binding protein
MMDDLRTARDDVERAAIAKKGSPYLTTKQAAFYLGLSPRTLEKMRAKGVGPKFYRIGRSARYLVRDLDAHWSANDVGKDDRHA